MSSSPEPAVAVAAVQDIPVVGEPASQPVIGEPQQNVVLGEPVHLPNGVPEGEPPLPAAPPAAESNGVVGHESPPPPVVSPSAPVVVSEDAAATEASSEVSPTDNISTATQENAEKHAETEAPPAADNTSELKTEASPELQTLAITEEKVVDEPSETKTVDVDALETKTSDAVPEPETVAASESSADDSSPAGVETKTDDASAKIEQISEVNVDEAPVIDVSSDTKTVAVSEASTIEDASSVIASTLEKPSCVKAEDRSFDINSLGDELKTEVNEIPHEPEVDQAGNQETHAVEQNVDVSANGESGCLCTHEDGGDAERERQELPNGESAEKEKRPYLQFMKVPLVVTGLAIAVAGVALASISRPH